MRRIGQGGVRAAHAALLAVLLFSLAGCATYHAGRRPPADATTAEAGRLYAALRGINAGLLGFKALGALRLGVSGMEQHFRSAWAARGPDKLRIDALGFAGQPVFSFSCDGKRDYILSYQKGRLFSRRASGGAMMDRLVHIPIDAGDLFALFCGRPGKSKDFLAVRLEKDPLQGRVLVLWNRCDGARSRVFLNRKPFCIREVERVDAQGRLEWLAEFKEMKERDGYRVPVDLLLSGPKGARVRITTERFWANPRMKKTLFVLKAR